MTPDFDKTGPDGQGRRHGHGEGRCGCGGRHRQDEVALSREEEIVVLERRIADSQARLDELRRG